MCAALQGYSGIRLLNPGFILRELSLAISDKAVELAGPRMRQAAFLPPISLHLSYCHVLGSISMCPDQCVTVSLSRFF